MPRTQPPRPGTRRRRMCAEFSMGSRQDPNAGGAGGAIPARGRMNGQGGWGGYLPDWQHQYCSAPRQLGPVRMVFARSGRGSGWRCWYLALAAATAGSWRGLDRCCWGEERGGCFVTGGCLSGNLILRAAGRRLQVHAASAGRLLLVTL